MARAISWAQRVYRCLLLAAPRRFRETYGDEMTRVFVERCTQAASRRTAIQLCLWGCVDVVVQGVAQRLEARRVARAFQRRGVAASIDRFRLDTVSGWRTWRRVPGVGLALMALLALGIGGVVVLFGPLYAIVLAPLPLPHPDELVRIGGRIPLYNGYLDAFEHRERLEPIFAGVTAFAPGSPTQVTIAGRRQNISVECVTPEFFETAGVQPRLGRSLFGSTVTAAEVVLSDRAWDALFNRAGDVIGKSIRLSDIDRVVVGVMPRGFDFPEDTDLWLPMRTFSHASDAVQFVGRLRSGQTLNHAAAGLTAIGYQRGRGPTGIVGGDGPVLQLLRTYMYGDERPLVWNLWAVALLFLLLTCAGGTNLLLAQGSRRRTELSVRLALGAERSRLVRQLLTETLLLVLVSSLIGLWLSTAAGRWLVAQWPGLPHEAPIPGTLAFAAALAGVVTVLCGLAPARFATNTDIASAIKFGTHGAPVRRPVARRWSLRDLLAGVQLALALALVVGTGLLGRSLAAHLAVPLGFDARDVSVLSVDLPHLSAISNITEQFRQQHHLGPFLELGPRDALMGDLNKSLAPARHAENERNVLFFRDAEARLAALPDVVNVGLMLPAPFTTAAARTPRTPIFTSLPPPSGILDQVPMVAGFHEYLGGDVIRALGIRLNAGRHFTDADQVAAAQAAEQSRAFCADCAGRPAVVAIVNEAAARQLWPTEDAIGKHAFCPPFDTTIVGVVADVQQDFQRSDMPTIYLPRAAAPKGDFVVKLRAGTSLSTFRAEADRILGSLIADLPPVDAQSMPDLSTHAFANLRLALWLLAGFAVVGAVVAGLGVYASATLMAAERTQEMAIRAALGAHTSEIRFLAFRRSVRVMVAALPVGLAAGWLLARGLAHLLFQVPAADPTTYLISSGLLAVIVSVAGFVPAWRLAAADPLRALREE